MTIKQNRHIIKIVFALYIADWRKDMGVQGKVTRAFLFREEGKLEDYIVDDRVRIPVGEGYISIVNQEQNNQIRLDEFKGRLDVNGCPCSPEDKKLEIHGKEIVRFYTDSVTVLIIAKTVTSDFQWKSVPLTESFPVIKIANRRGDWQDKLQEVVLHQGEEKEQDDQEAKLCLKDDGWHLQDINAEDGASVNGVQVQGAVRLNQMDIVQVRGTYFFIGNNQLFYSQTVSKVNNLSIHIVERSVKSFFKKHTLLQDIKLTIDPGKMVLILGGSGAGKTTFVNAVTGYEKAKAQILQGGVDVYEHYDEMKHSIGFVPQQDLLRENDTVRKTLENAAQMRLPKSYSSKGRRERTEQVLEMLGLSSFSEELVRKLSGGQRKRLSIGVELISNPTLFVLDEPDSGLDGVMAKELMRNLRKIADEERIVVVITHTPDRVIDLFDQVIVLAKGNKDHIGHLAFFGDIADARRFFGKETMEEIVLAVNAKNEGGEGRADEFIEKYRLMNRRERNG